MTTETPKAVFPHIKSCPRCGGERFRVFKTWHGVESYKQSAPNFYRTLTRYCKDEQYHDIWCENCEFEIDDVDDLFLQPPPAA